MGGGLRNRNSRVSKTVEPKEPKEVKTLEPIHEEVENKIEHEIDVTFETLDVTEPVSEVEIYAKEVLDELIKDNLPPTPNNFSLYFDRLLEKKSEHLNQQIKALLELESNDNNYDQTIILEQNLKQGFVSIKNLLGVTASLYKNMSLMSKILEKRKNDLVANISEAEVVNIVNTLSDDVKKLNTILKKQSSQMKGIYDTTATIVKQVENETIFDNKFGVYNKRYLISKIEQELELVDNFNHKSSLIMIELSKELKDEVKNEKAVHLMIKTIARLLLKTSRRSDIVAHYGDGIFSMLLKHTDIESAKKASHRLCELVSNSNFFLADRDIQLKVSIGIANIKLPSTVDEIVSNALDGIDIAYNNPKIDYYANVEIEEK